ncbi:MAG: CopG family ribbon-helix-helix protein [Dehalococcoidia bacterium]
MKKIAITLPDHQAEAIERIRSQRGVPRSRVIQQALDLYLASQQAIEAADDAYEAGYRAYPERLSEIEAYTRTATETLTPEDWE